MQSRLARRRLDGWSAWRAEAEPQRTRREFLETLLFCPFRRGARPIVPIPAGRANYFSTPLNLSLPLLPQIPARYPGIGPLRGLQPTHHHAASVEIHRNLSHSGKPILAPKVLYGIGAYRDFHPIPNPNPIPLTGGEQKKAEYREMKNLKLIA